MSRYIVRRLLAMGPLLVLITSIIFFVGQYGAGDLAAYLTAQQGGGRIDPVLYHTFRQRLQLDQPFYVRYGDWLGHAIHGDLGVSYVTAGEPSVNYLITQAVPISLQIGLAALVLVVLVGIPAGILAALFRNGPVDQAVVGAATVLSSVPLFVLAPLATYVLVIQVHLVPSVGIGWHGLVDQASILPVGVLAANSCLTTVRFTRASVLETLGQDYVRAARAKGLQEWRVVARHVVKNALIPVLSALGLTTSYLLSGSLFVEIVFNLQGFGMLTYNALEHGDIQTLSGVILVTALILMLTNLVTDILYSVADPRVKLGARA